MNQSEHKQNPTFLEPLLFSLVQRHCFGYEIEYMISLTKTTEILAIVNRRDGRFGKSLEL